MPEIENPAQMRPALAFALLYAVLLAVVAWTSDFVGSRGVYAVATVSGLVDVDAITLSSLRLFGLNMLTAPEASTAIVLAMSANALFKLVIVATVGGKALLRRCLPAMLATMTVAGLALRFF